jgi:acyl carrier protein
MELNEFIKNFSEQFDDTEKSLFTPETQFRKLDEWSSLIALSIIAMVDEEYDVTLKGDDIIQSKTINDLFEKILSKK